MDKVRSKRDTTMQRRELLSLAPLLLLPETKKVPRPNIVLILPDQMRGMDMGCAGNREVRTPHLDRLASESAWLPNSFANTPVCCPARAILMTGQYCHRNGMTANDLRLRTSQITIAETLQKAGYRTGFVGKWHLDGGPRLPGFVPPGPRRQGFEFWAANECDHRPFGTHYFRDDNTPRPFGKFEAEGWTDLATEFLEQSGADKRPFCLMVFMGPPHDPYVAPEPYLRSYPPNQVSLRGNWQEGLNVPGRKELAAYYAAITAVDEQIGRLTGTLDRLNLRDDTVLMVSSDHGDMLGSHGLRLKRKPWEESIRVPGIIRYPRAIRPGKRDALFSHIDVAPTILGLCGVKPTTALAGSDLSGYLRGTSDKSPESVFFQIFGPYHGDGTEVSWRGIRTREYMYARTEKSAWVLYDLRTDPLELKNLAGQPASADLQKKLDALLLKRMKETGDSWQFDWTHPVEDDGRLYKHETFESVDDYLRWAKAHPDLDKMP